MKLTRVERWMLFNQYRILELVDSEGAAGHKAAAEALEDGFEREYAELCSHITQNELSKDDCDETIDILQMHRCLLTSFDKLEDTGDVKRDSLQFFGFDGNDSHEGRRRAYVEYYCRRSKGIPMFAELNDNDRYNSHSPMLDAYQRMLEQWHAAEDQNHLTLDDIKQIIGARRHPSN